HGKSVGLDSQFAADFCFFALVRLYGRGPVSEPACPGWSDLKVLVADLFAFEEQGKFPLVRLKYAAGGGISFLGVRVAECKNEKEKKCRECQVSAARTEVSHAVPQRALELHAVPIERNAKEKTCGL